VRYWALVRAGFRRYASYRAATVAGVFTNTVFGFIRAAILLAAIEAGGEIGGYDRQAALSYVFLGQALIMTMAIWRWIELATRIKSGDVVTDLQRPMDMQTMYMAEDYGRGLYQILARGIPPMVIGALVYTLQWPTSPFMWLAFGVSVLLGIGVSFGVRFLWNLAAFWVLDDSGLVVAASLCATLLSGLALPLAFYPTWAERIMTVLPWASMIQIPIDVFLGRHTGAGLAGALALQAAWLVALYLLGRGVLGVATKRVVVQGG
jgi:ABC-2 type transport system permease protein